MDSDEDIYDQKISPWDSWESRCRPLSGQPDTLLDVVPDPEPLLFDVRGGVVVRELHDPVDHVGSGQAEQILVDAKVPCQALPERELVSQIQ